MFSVKFASGILLPHSFMEQMKLLKRRWSTTGSKWIQNFMKWFFNIETQPNHIPRIDVRTTKTNWSCPSFVKWSAQSPVLITHPCSFLLFFFGGCILVLMKFVRICLQIRVWPNFPCEMGLKSNRYQMTTVWWSFGPVHGLVFVVLQTALNSRLLW